ncbi:ABC transporter substrate-binding protein [Desulfoscipio sp. XC116]|uniref:ABC transporter substrate-binding protein n=1 Tax=Desulfoscipio sp. XC116 TaxID=3144975 RepID=UPI00325B8080
MHEKKISCLLGLTIIALLVLSLAGCGQTASTPADQDAATRTITDMAGRSVTVPVTIKTAFSTNPIGAIALYTLCPDKMVGWNYELRPDEKKFISPEYQSLPNLGGWYAKNTGNTEELLKVKPDVLINLGAINNTEISNADKIQKQLGIPVVLIDAPVTGMDKALEFMGDLLGEKTRAQELADYCRNTIDDVTAKAAQIPSDQRVRVYYAEGPKGLETEPDGSRHIETLQVVGGINVAEVTQQGAGGMNAGQTPVSMEQVLSWNPEVILAWQENQGGFYQGIMSDPAWQPIKAVQQHRVYRIPNAPYNWFDRPPSVNRIIGFKWLGNLLYPEVFNYDMVTEVKNFYQKFYHYDLSDEQAKALLSQEPAAN